MGGAAVFKLMGRCFPRFVRGGVFVFFVLSVAGELRAAFEVSGAGLAALTGETVTISRQSLETRTDATVATARVVNGQVQFRVDGEPGLYAVQVGDLTQPFVAGSDQKLWVALSAEGKNLQVSGARDQE